MFAFTGTMITSLSIKRYAIKSKWITSGKFTRTYFYCSQNPIFKGPNLIKKTNPENPNQAKKQSKKANSINLILKKNNPFFLPVKSHPIQCKKPSTVEGFFFWNSCCAYSLMHKKPMLSFEKQWSSALEPGPHSTILGKLPGGKGLKRFAILLRWPICHSYLKNC